MVLALGSSDLRPRRVRSRKGCLCCRRRRKKCDELKPVCVACQRNKLDCTWPETSDGNANPDPSTSTAVCVHEKESSIDSVDRRIQMFLDIFRAACTHPRPRLHPELSFQLSQNLHHYLDHTASTFEALTPNAFRPLWTGLVLEDAKAFPFVMNSLDAITSLHRAHLYSDDAPRHIELACRSRAASIHDFRSAVSEVTAQNASGTLTFSAIQIILCLEFPIALKRLDSPNIIDGAYELLVAIRGFFHLQPVTCPYITDPFLCAWMRSSRPDPPKTPPNPGLLPSLSHLHDIMKQLSLPAGQRALFSTALTQLYTFFSTVALDALDWTVIFTWPVLLPEAFINLIHQRNPLALVIMAHWFVPVFRNATHWLLHAWAEQVLSGVAGSIGPEWQFLLDSIGSPQAGCPASITGTTASTCADMELADSHGLRVHQLCIHPLLEEYVRSAPVEDLDA